MTDKQGSERGGERRGRSVLSPHPKFRRQRTQRVEVHAHTHTYTHTQAEIASKLAKQQA